MSLLGDRWLEARIALGLLSRLPTGPLPERLIPTGDAAWAFPLVGCLLGMASGLVFLLAAAFLPSLVAAILAIAAGVLLTGALHEDGLADVADGFGGGATAETRLDIMRDSRIGTYGVVALVLVLGLIAAAISALPATPGTLCLFVAIGAASRAAMLLPMAALAPARAEGLGHGAVLQVGARFWVGLALGALAALLALPLLLIAIALAAGAMHLIAIRQIGGQTGDVLGATQKLAECAAWIVAVAYVNAS